MSHIPLRRLRATLLSGRSALVLLGWLPLAADAASYVQVTFESGTGTMLDAGGAALTPGSALDGDGAIIQLGYFDAATVGNNFAGTWHALTGAGSLNTGGNSGSGLPFTTTSIGDIGGGAAPDGSGIFAFDLRFEDTVAGTFNDLPASTAIPLAIRFYNGTSLAGSTHFNTVSNDSWLWKVPAVPAPLPPTINMALSDAGLEWQSIAVAGQAPSTAFRTSIVVVPEPNMALLAGSGLIPLLARRHRSRRDLRRSAVE